MTTIPSELTWPGKSFRAKAEATTKAKMKTFENILNDYSFTSEVLAIIAGCFYIRNTQGTSFLFVFLLVLR